MQPALEVVDGSRLGGFTGGLFEVKECLYTVVDPEMHLNLYWWLHLVRGSAEIRDEVGTVTRPWTILNIVVSL